MRVLLLLLLATPVWAQNYPPELPPQIDPGRALNIMGLLALDEPRDESGVIDVCFAFSTAAWNANGGQAGSDGQATAIVSQFNQARVNSSTVGTLRKASVFQAAYVETGSPLSWMAGFTAGYPAMQAELGRVGCDIVHMQTLDAACGIGYLTASSMFPFSASHRDCTVGNMSGIHEIGHNIGLQHEPGSVCGQPICSGYAYGHAWPTTGVFERDPMTYPVAGGSRVLWWSNPLIVRHGQPIGITDQRDNARAMTANAARVAGFRTLVTPRKPARPVRARVEPTL